MPKYCSECGKELLDNPKFCPDCRNQLSMESKSAKKTLVTEPQEDHCKTLATIYLIIGFLSILLPLIIFVSMET